MYRPEVVDLPLSQQGLLSAPPRPELVLRRRWLGYVKRSSETDCYMATIAPKRGFPVATPLPKGGQRLFSSTLCQSEPVGLQFLSIPKRVIF